MTEKKGPARTAHMRSLSADAARAILEDGGEIGPRLWGCHNLWRGRKCVGRITDHIFSVLMPELVRAVGGYEVRWRARDDVSN